MRLQTQPAKKKRRIFKKPGAFINDVIIFLILIIYLAIFPIKWYSHSVRYD